MNLKQLLKDDLTINELNLLNRSFDNIGDIAQLEIPKELVNKEKLIANKVLNYFKQVNVVVKRLDITKGEFRVRKVKVLAGENRTTTIHKENGIRLKLDLNKVFFTPRLNNERLRVLSTIKKGDIVADLFCGVGPYSILISKYSKCKKVIANDLNPVAYKFLIENVKLNKVKNIECFNKDARSFNIKVDKFIMNIPKFSDKFIKVGFDNCKKKGRIFYYCFARVEELNSIIKKIKQVHKCRILKKTKCGDLGPKIYRWCIDIKKL